MSARPPRRQDSGSRGVHGGRPTRAIAFENSSSLPPGQGEESGPPLGNALDGRTGRRAAPSSLLSPGRGEVGRGVDPGAGPPGQGSSRSRSSVNCLGAPASRRLGGPKARILVRASREAGGNAGTAGGGTPLPTSPLKGGGVRAGRGEERGSGSRRTGRRAAPSSLLPPGRGEVGRGVDPGARPPGQGSSRSRSSVNCLGAPASRRLGGPKARTLVRASRGAGGTPALPGVGPPRAIALGIMERGCVVWWHGSCRAGSCCPIRRA